MADDTASMIGSLIRCVRKQQGSGDARPWPLPAKIAPGPGRPRQWPREPVGSVVLWHASVLHIPGSRAHGGLLLLLAPFPGPQPHLQVPNPL